MILKKMSKIFYNISRSLVCILPCLAFSCARYDCGGDQNDRIPVNIRIEYDSFDEAGTKSSYSFGESEIRDIQLFIVDKNRRVYESIYAESIYGLEFIGEKGQDYLIYAVANMGGKITLTGISSQSSFESSLSFPALPANGIPMISKEAAQVSVNGQDCSVHIKMVRMAARIDLHINKERLGNKNGFTVGSVLLHDASVRDAYDIASGKDLQVINRGGTISLYAMENLQGTLLPNNRDPWAKVPENIPGAADKCTYLEVRCSYESNGISSDNITYRMYLGSDNTSNFDVRRNTVYNLTLIPTEGEIYGFRGSWKIESSDWNGKIPISISFSETYKELFVKGPNAGGKDSWTPVLKVEYSDGSFAEKKASLSSKNSSIAAIDGSSVLGNGTGSTTIHAVYEENGFSVETMEDATVKVTDPLLFITLKPERLTLSAGQSYSEWKVIKSYPSGDRELRWNYDEYRSGNTKWTLTDSDDLSLEVTGNAVTVRCSPDVMYNSNEILTVSCKENGDECSSSCEISVTAPARLTSLTAEPDKITLDYDNGWSSDYHFYASFSDGSVKEVTTVTGLDVSCPSFVTETNGTIIAKDEGEGTMTGSYTHRGITKTASIRVTSLEEWFTIGLQFRCVKNGSQFTISDIKAVKMSQFSSEEEERYILLHSGEFEYDVTGNITVRKNGDGFIVNAPSSTYGILTISYHCPVLDEDVTDDIIFENGNCSYISD